MLDTLPQEITDLVFDKARAIGVPYGTIAGLSTKFLYTGLAHAKRQLESISARHRESQGLDQRGTSRFYRHLQPCIPRQDWLECTDIKRWFRLLDKLVKTHESSKKDEAVASEQGILSPNKPQGAYALTAQSFEHFRQLYMETADLGLPTLRQNLSSWACSQNNTFCTTEAALRILECYTTGSRRLNLSGLRLMSLPVCIGSLTSITHLNISRNPLIAIPPELKRLTRLEQFHCAEAMLGEAPNIFSEMPNLGVVALQGNNLERLPESLWQCKKLRSLNFGDNRLTSLPDKLWTLDAMEWLDFQGNQISFVADELKNLTDLKKIFMARNRLTDYPDCFDKLKLLQVVSIDYNADTSLPSSLQQAYENGVVNGT